MGWEWRIFVPLDGVEEQKFPFSDAIEMIYDDTYYKGNEKFGIKQRSGKREFEVKELMEYTKRAAEYYKKHFVANKSEVLSLTKDFDSNISITIHKERQKQVQIIENRIFEYEVAYVNCNNNAWKSICWEGEPKMIYDSVQKYFNLKDGWNLSDIQLPSESIIGGYPRLVAHILSTL